MLYLNRRITIQASAAGQDSYGQPATTWTDVTTRWANIEDISGRQYVIAGAEKNAVQTKITLRYTAGILPSMRVVAVNGGDVYNIEAVLGQDQKTLQLMCSRGVNNG